jgi:hypothetical protein
MLGEKVMIDATKLIDYAVKFHLGRFEIDTLTGTPSVNLERVREGWVIRAEHPGSGNPHYLNKTGKRWRYKVGSAFDTPAQAIECLNEWFAVSTDGASSPA